jgi:hypothetical protein
MLVFFICMLQVFHLDAYVYLQWLHTYFQVVFLGVFQVFQVYVTSVSAVSDISCECFNWYCKSRSGVAYIAVYETHLPQPPELLGRRRGSPCGHVRSTDTFAAQHPLRGQVARTHVGFCLRTWWSGETERALW